MHAHRLPTLLAFMGLTSLLAVACGSDERNDGDDNDNLAGSTITIYSGRSEAMVGELFSRFEQETGIKINAVYDRTPTLASRLERERAQTPADVYFAQDPGYLGALANAGMLAELPPELLAPVDERMRDAEGRWVGTSARLRVLTYNPDLIREQDLPKSLAEMVAPRFRSMSWAPRNGSLHAHLSALRHIWGDDETREFLEKLRDKEGVSRQDSNRPQVAAVGNGDVAFAWVNHYYLHALGGEQRIRARNYSFPATNDAGNIMMVAGAGILETSRNKAAARKFIEFLLSEQAQEFFAQENFEYPTRKGVPTHPDVRPLDEISLAEVPQAALADVRPTVRMLQDLGLQ